VAVDGISHKLVQPGETRWLSYDGSVAVVLKHYSAICLALEAINADAGLTYPAMLADYLSN
jgi:hypothetical protein